MAAVAALGSVSTFEELLTALMDASNETRSRAEALFEECKAHPEQLVSHTVRCLRTSGRPELRDLAAVLLRKVRSGSQVACSRHSPFSSSWRLARPRSGHASRPPRRRA